MKKDHLTICRDDWQLLEEGRAYKTQIGLYDLVRKNERFYRGDQWHGVKSGGLPTPVFNIFKRVIGYFISTLMSQKITLRYTAESCDLIHTGKERIRIDEGCRLLSSYLNYRMERDNIEKLIGDGLLDAALTGNCYAYVYWDSDKIAPKGFRGDFATTLIDAVNVFFGDVNTTDIESQPYILITGRELVDKLIKEAKANGCADAEKHIIPDSDTEGQAGDFGAIEIPGTKCSSLIKLWKENGSVHYQKTTRGCIVTPPTNTGLLRYPIASMSWDSVKNSCHGEAVATGLIENQLYINKAFAMVMKHMLDVSFSKVVYNDTIIDEWTNAVGEAIAVHGDVVGAVEKIEPGSLQSGYLELINMTMATTKELMGATDAALGNVAPNNTSAIIALQNASSLPLDNQKRSLYRFLSDLGMIWMDFLFHYYGDGRILFFKERDGSMTGYTFEGAALSDIAFSCYAEAGPSSYWSDIASVNTLDSLLKGGYITLKQYLERIPDGYIPDKEKLLEEISSGETEAKV